MSLSAFNRMRRLKAQQENDNVKALDEMAYQELRALAKERGIEDYYKMDTEVLRAALKEGE